MNKMFGDTKATPTGVPSKEQWARQKGLLPKSEPAPVKAEPEEKSPEEQPRRKFNPFRGPHEYIPR